LGKGDGTFQPARTFGIAVQPGPMTVGDFNGDGRQDLVMADSSSNSVHIFLTNGNGTFQAVRNAGVGAQPRSLAVGDFNADGLQDLATVNIGSNTSAILLGHGDGTFQPSLTVELDPRGRYLPPVGVMSAADFDSDGRQDLAVFNSGDVSILLGRGDGTFE